MGQTIAEALREEGELRGALRNSQETLQILLEDKFGPLSTELVRRIATVTEASRLQAAIRQVARLSTLDELQL